MSYPYTDDNLMRAYNSGDGVTFYKLINPAVNRLRGLHTDITRGWRKPFTSYDHSEHVYVDETELRKITKHGLWKTKLPFYLNCGKADRHFMRRVCWSFMDEYTGVNQ